MRTRVTVYEYDPGAFENPLIYIMTIDEDLDCFRESVITSVFSKMECRPDRLMFITENQDGVNSFFWKRKLI